MKNIIQIIPDSKNNNKIVSLLKNNHIKKLFCLHDWLYWKSYGSNKIHRVCRKCYKKQSKTYNHLPTFWKKDQIKIK